MKKNLLLATIVLVAITLLGFIFSNISYADVVGEMRIIDGKKYWYENGKRQGMYGDEKNIWDTIFGNERGREIYDPESDAWYWLDACFDGAVAINKEVWMPYIYQEDLKTGANPEGKWVRYDNDGHMIKGWYTNENGKYYYDLITGAMSKGVCEIENKLYYFDEITGILKKQIKGWYTDQNNNTYYCDEKTGKAVRYFALVTENGKDYIYYFHDKTAKMIRGNLKAHDAYDLEKGEVEIYLTFDNNGKCEVTDDVLRELNKLTAKYWPLYNFNTKSEITLEDYLKTKAPVTPEEPEEPEQPEELDGFYIVLDETGKKISKVYYYENNEKYAGTLKLKDSKGVRHTFTFNSRGEMTRMDGNKVSTVESITKYFDAYVYNPATGKTIFIEANE